MKKNLGEEITGTKTALLKAIDRFDQDNINTIPFEGSWTGGQVAEHVLKSAAGVLGAITGEVKPADRDPELHVKQLADIFLNFNSKLQSPDFIIPSNEPKDKQYLLAALEKTFDGIARVVESENLAMICTSFEMPVLGHMSRLEFINFTVFHTQRHIHQLDNILKHLKKHDNVKSIY